MAESSIGNTYWFDAEINGNLLYVGSNFNTPILNQTTSYYVKPALGDCSTIETTEVIAHAYLFPVLNNAPFTLEQCDNDFDGFNFFNLTEINNEIVPSITSEIFTYYKSANR